MVTILSSGIAERNGAPFVDPSGEGLDVQEEAMDGGV